MSRHALRRLGGSALLLIVMVAALVAATAETVQARQEATPAAMYSCATASPAAATPEMAGGMGTMGMGTPMAGMGMAVEFDQLYIDMMIPHHAAIIAMAQVAESRLTDERLREIAIAIVATQTPEIEELRGFRAQFYGSVDPAPMDAGMMHMMGQMMPGMGTTTEMAFQMDAAAQVAAICAAEDPNLAFIDLTIAHHRMAIVASEMALTQAMHQEIKDFAQRVIDAQQREIDELTAIRAELAGMATPAG